MAGTDESVRVHLDVGDTTIDFPVPVTKKQLKILQEGAKVASVIKEAITNLAEGSDEDSG